MKEREREMRTGGANTNVQRDKKKRETDGRKNEVSLPPRGLDVRDGKQNDPPRKKIERNTNYDS
jgi:hypothetical protein